MVSRSICCCSVNSYMVSISRLFLIIFLTERLDDRGRSLAGADALRGNAIALAAAPEFFGHGHHQTRARGADGMADAQRSAVDVHFFFRDAEFSQRCNNLTGKSFIELDAVHLVRRNPRMPESLL